jgi:hypothetical protein
VENVKGGSNYAHSNISSTNSDLQNRKNCNWKKFLILEIGFLNTFYGNRASCHKQCYSVLFLAGF